MKKMGLAVLILMFGFPAVMAMSGCAVYKAMAQPDKKDLNVLNVDTSRDLVIAELGTPVISGQEDGRPYDVFSFIQGYSKAAKTARALTHGILDFFTIGLWEGIATPIEGVASGSKMKIKVFYRDGRVLKVENLTPPSQPSQSQESTQESK